MGPNLGTWNTWNINTVLHQGVWGGPPLYAEECESLSSDRIGWVILLKKINEQTTAINKYMKCQKPTFCIVTKIKNNEFVFRQITTIPISSPWDSPYEFCASLVLLFFFFKPPCRQSRWKPLPHKIFNKLNGNMTNGTACGLEGARPNYITIFRYFNSVAISKSWMGPDGKFCHGRNSCPRHWRLSVSYAGGNWLIWGSPWNTRRTSRYHGIGRFKGNWKVNSLNWLTLIEK